MTTPNNEVRLSMRVRPKSPTEFVENRKMPTAAKNTMVNDVVSAARTCAGSKPGVVRPRPPIPSIPRNDTTPMAKMATMRVWFRLWKSAPTRMAMDRMAMSTAPIHRAVQRNRRRSGASVWVALVAMGTSSGAASWASHCGRPDRSNPPRMWSDRLVPLQNRVTPFGDIIETSARGLLYGNRGVLHDEHRRLIRTWQVRRWIACLLSFKRRRRVDQMPPGRYTGLYFLDEATAFAAGHRPCAECRREEYRRFQEACRVARAAASTRADDMDRVLHDDRLGPDGSKRGY